MQIMHILIYKKSHLNLLLRTQETKLNQIWVVDGPFKIESRPNKDYLFIKI
jgi:hypothetical protein